MNNKDWNLEAQTLLFNEQLSNVKNNPEPTGVFVNWREGIYFGSIQYIESKYSNEIILLSKTSDPLNDNLVDAIKRIDNKRLDLSAQNELDLTGRTHILRKIGYVLVNLNLEQTKYMVANFPQVYEI